MRVDDFDFDLPEDRIALRPAEPRDSARLLGVDPNAQPLLSDRLFSDLPDLLNPGDLVVLNDTKVIPAELHGRRVRNGNTAKIAVNLHLRADARTWRAFARPAKRLIPGDVIDFAAQDTHPAIGGLSARVANRGEGGEVTLVFGPSGAELDTAIAEVGAMPLPPYIANRRPQDARDLSDYQTIYASREGAVAAPTAGLHFTAQLLDALQTRGIGLAKVTLHVSAGTFLPVKADDTDDHVMHAEWGQLSPQTAERINQAKASGGAIVAAGTTALRLLESAAQESAEVSPFEDSTDIFIKPGYRFRAVDRLITNFHLPRSTLFMLVSGFCGIGVMQEAYRHAVDAGYRFYSYGDACLLTRAASQ